jgi:hypothetical protein
MLRRRLGLKRYDEGLITIIALPSVSHLCGSTRTDRSAHLKTATFCLILCRFCAYGHSDFLPATFKNRQATEAAMTPTTSKSNPPKWVLSLCREMQTSIGLQLRTECELPKELAPDLSGLVARLDKEAVGTC